LGDLYRTQHHSRLLTKAHIDGLFLTLAQAIYITSIAQGALFAFK
jgi:hypothetical protein